MVYNNLLGILDSDQEVADDVESNHTNDDNVAVSNQSAANVESPQTNDESLGNFCTIEIYNQLILFSKESATAIEISNKELITFSGI
jgi:hypothetical protein